MRTISPSNLPQSRFFDVLSQLDNDAPLIALGNCFPWHELERAFSDLYSHKGRGSKPIRLMCGLLILKQLYNLSDESVVSQWKQNPYYQVFCGETSFQNTLLCHSTELVKFRQRLGKAGIEKLLSLSVALHGDTSEEATVLVDTTVQEKAITYPTDSKLAIKSINRLNKLAKSEGVKQRRTFVKEVKALRLACRHFRHVKRPQDKNKIYSLHESDIYCVGKGKDHKMYEYGRKASVVSTVDSQVIVGVESHDEHIHDSKTLSSALASANGNRKTAIELAVVIAVPSNMLTLRC